MDEITVAIVSVVVAVLAALARVNIMLFLRSHYPDGRVCYKPDRMDQTDHMIYDFSTRDCPDNFSKGLNDAVARIEDFVRRHLRK